jgi:hypothetical protein
MKQAIIRIAAFGLSALAITATITAPANAQTAPAFVDITFTGTVTRAANDTIVASNPDGSTTTLSGTQIPDYRYNAGDNLVTTFRFLTNQPAFANASCGGRFALGFAAQITGNPCGVELSSVNTPFGFVGLGGLGGDANPTITGLDLLLDPDGTYLVDMPMGSYSMRYVGVNPFLYNAATGELLPPGNVVCVDPFSCPAGVITGTATGWSANVPIRGQFGNFSGSSGSATYDAGSAGTFSVSGLFGTGGGPVDVPEPASLLFFGAGAAALAARRRRAKKA